MTAPFDAAKDVRISQLELQIGDLYGAIARKNAALLAAADALDEAAAWFSAGKTRQQLVPTPKDVDLKMDAASDAAREAAK